MSEFASTPSEPWDGDAVALLRDANSELEHLTRIGVSSSFILDTPVDSGEPAEAGSDKDAETGGDGSGVKLEATLTCCKTFKLSPRDKEAVMTLLESNMRSYYEKTWGWDRESKTKELFNPGSYFLLIHTPGPEGENTELAGFAMFRFSWDDEEEPEFPVLFTYELQIQPKWHGQGIGRRLMQLQLEIAKSWNMWKTMLSCFKLNTKAMDFYMKIGFGVDGNSPSSHGYDGAEYEILSDKPKRRC